MAAPPPPSPRPPSRGPASVLAAASAVEPALHRLRQHREPWLDPGSGAGVTIGGAEGDDTGPLLPPARSPSGAALLQECNRIGKSSFDGLRARRRAGRMAASSNPGRLLPEGIRNEESTSERRSQNWHYGKSLRLSKGGAAPLQHQRRPGRQRRRRVGDNP